MSERATNQIGRQSRAKRAGSRVGVLWSPVVERELRAAFHRRDARKSRFKTASIGVAGVSVFMLLGALTGRNFGGGTVHFYLFLVAMCLATGPALQISVGLFAEERRQQTLELLYLAGMGSGELFVGKLLGGALVASCDLLALAPLMAVPFMTGGLSLDLFAATAACLPTVFVLVLAIGSLASALCKDEGTASVLSSWFAGVACLALPLPYNLGVWLSGTAPFDHRWLILSPALGPWMIFKNFGGYTVRDFWTWTALTWGWSVACLTLAAVMLKRNWRRDLERAVAVGWQAKWESFALGSEAWRESLRRRVLAVNAYQWLAQKDRRPVLLAWGFMAAVCVLWLLGWCAWPHLWPSAMNFYTTAVLLLVGMTFLVSYAAARRMAADRRDGSLELLLTTPLSPEEMVTGQEAALREQFRPVQRALSGLLLLMVLAGLLTRSWTTYGIITYLAVWCLFFVCRWRVLKRGVVMPMWVAANCGQAMFGTFRTQGGIWNVATSFYVWWMMFTAFGGFSASFPGGSLVEMVIVLSVGFVMVIFMVLPPLEPPEPRERLVNQLRSIAQEPVPERNDPRFKVWTKQMWTRFPAAPDGRFGQLDENWVQPAPVKAIGGRFWRMSGRVCGSAWRKLRKAVKQHGKLPVK